MVTCSLMVWICNKIACDEVRCLKTAVLNSLGSSYSLSRVENRALCSPDVLKIGVFITNKATKEIWFYWFRISISKDHARLSCCIFRNVYFTVQKLTLCPFLVTLNSTEPQSFHMSKYLYVRMGCVFACTCMHKHIHTFVPCTLVRSISVCRHRPLMGVVEYGMAPRYLTLWCFGVIHSLVLLTKRIW